MGNNLYSNLVNFYNVNDENFKEFIAEIYKEMLTTHRDVQYVKEHLTEEIVKILDKYLVDGKFNINIEEKVNEFLENNQEIKDINTQLTTNTSNIKNLTSQLEDIAEGIKETINLNKVLTDIEGFSKTNDGASNAKAINDYMANTTFDNLKLVIPNDSFHVDSINLNKPNITIDGEGTLINCTINCDFGLHAKPNVKLRNFKLKNETSETKIAITLKCVRSGLIENIDIDSYDTAIQGLIYTGSYKIQHIKTVIINKIRYTNCKNFFVNDMLDDFQEYSLGDIQITNCTGSATVNHLNLKGCDGLIFSNNVCFSGSSNGDMTKAENIKIDYGNFINISNNSLFEAGKEAVSLTRCQNININGNNIGWCGQAYPSYAIKLDGGAQLNNNIFVLANIANNIIDRPSQGGVFFGEYIGFSTINNNVVIGAGSRDYYYGSQEITDVFGINLSATSTTNLCTNNNMPQNAYNNLNDSNIIINNNFANKNYNYYKEITVADGKTTIDVSGVTNIVCNNSSYPFLTDFTNGYQGQVITLYDYNNRTGINREDPNSKIITKETSNLQIPAGATITFQKGYGGKWYEIGRSF